MIEQEEDIFLKTYSEVAIDCRILDSKTIKMFDFLFGNIYVTIVELVFSTNNPDITLLKRHSDIQKPTFVNM